MVALDKVHSPAFSGPSALYSPVLLDGSNVIAPNQLTYLRGIAIV